MHLYNLSFTLILPYVHFVCKSIFEHTKRHATACLFVLIYVIRVTFRFYPRHTTLILSGFQFSSFSIAAHCSSVPRYVMLEMSLHP